MIVTIPNELQALPHQREFVESDEPRLCFEGQVGGGKTHALILAAIREARVERHSVAFVVGCGDVFRNICDQAERIFWKCGVDRAKNQRGVRKPYKWTTGYGTIEFYSVESTMLSNAYFDLVCIDNADDFSVSELERIADHVKAGGKLRTTQNPNRRSDIAGRRIEAVIQSNPFLAAP